RPRRWPGPTRVSCPSCRRPWSCSPSWPATPPCATCWRPPPTGTWRGRCGRGWRPPTTARRTCAGASRLSADPAAEVRLGAPVRRVGEDLARLAVLHQLAVPVPLVRGRLHREERGQVRDPGRLLHVVGDD